MSETSKEKWALISVYSKAGIDTFARELTENGWKILSSGGTAKFLAGQGITVLSVDQLLTDSFVGLAQAGGITYSEKPEDLEHMKKRLAERNIDFGAILDHRVVTLSREVHAGLLARDNDKDRAELAKLGVPFINMVVCDFYPLAAEIAKQGCSVESVIELTDIGGPTMVRSAAKGGRLVIVDPADRQVVLDQIKANGEVMCETYQYLRAKAEYIVSGYCLDSARFHGQGEYDGFHSRLIDEALYGENAYQVPARLYGMETDDLLALGNFKAIAGSPPSYNNLIDIDRLLQTVTHIAAGFDVNYGKVPKIGSAAKHGNTCGAAVGEDPIQVLKDMVMGDPRAVFGGLVMVNFPIDETLAEVLLGFGVAQGQRRLLDGIIAPSFTEGAIEMMKRKKDKCRFIVNSALENLDRTSLDGDKRFRKVRGGFLTQPNYTFVLDFNHSEMKIYGPRNAQAEADLILAWAVGCTANSNTITIASNGSVLGNGAGRQDRVGAGWLAIDLARGGRHDLTGAAVYSDSFFPFIDGPALLIAYGIKTIFSTSGSVADEKVQALCQAAGVTLYQMPDKIARGFYNH